MAPDVARPELAQPDEPEKGGRRRWGSSERRLRLSGPVAVVLLAFLVLFPLAMILIASFINGTPLAHSGADFSPRTSNYSALWTTGTLHALINSLVAGVVGTVVAVAVGGTMAWLVARTNVPCRGLLSLAGVIPLFIPALVGALAWSLLCAPDTGYLSLGLHSLGVHWQFNIYSLKGMIWVFSLYNVPYAFIFINNALNLMNAELEEAAAVHGAGRLRVALRTTLPLVKPALFNAALLIFALILEDFPVSIILGFSNRVETLSSRVYLLMSQSPPQINTAAALGVLLMALTIVIVVLQRRLLRGQSFATVTGKGMKVQPMQLGAWRWVGLAFVLLYLLCAVVLPIGALVIGALQNSFYTPSFGSIFDISTMSFTAMKKALTDPDLLVAARNTITVGVITAVIGIALCFFLAHYAHRSNNWLGRLVGKLTILPAAVPGVVLGLGMLWAYTALPLPLYGTLGILVLAFLTRFLPQGVGNMASGIVQIHPDLEDSASVAGATKFRAATWVTLPLMRTAVASTGLLLFVLAMRELSASIFLYTARTTVLPIYLFNLWSNGSIAPVASISLAYTAFLFIVVLAGRKQLNHTA